MNTDCDEQFTLIFPHKKDVRGQFDGGHLATDTGLTLLREHEANRRTFERASRNLNDSRQPGKVQHLQPDVLRQRSYGIIAGYEDAEDHDELREDPIFQMLNEEFEDIEEDTGASQSTISRMENDITARSVVQLNEWLLEDFIRRNESAPPDSLTLEIDPTDDPVHGNQQLEMYNGFYDQHMYFPLLVFDAESGDCLCARLRRGNAHAKEKAQPHLKRIIRTLQGAFSGVEIEVKLRADAGFMDPKLYQMLEGLGVDWAINLTKNAVLAKRTEDLMEDVKQKYEESEDDETITRYTGLWYRAESWNKKRRVCAKVQYGPQGANRRFVVTTIHDELPGQVFGFYEARGQCENYIKELKNGLYADRLSCSGFVANAFRLLEHVLAYNVLNNFRRTVLCGTELEDADIHTLRRKLFKVAARIKVTTRKIWCHLSESWPFRSEFMETAQALGAVGG
jgi:hypothetical protein